MPGPYIHITAAKPAAQKQSAGGNAPVGNLSRDGNLLGNLHPARLAGEGFTSKYGDITYSTQDIATDVALGVFNGLYRRAVQIKQRRRDPITDSTVIQGDRRIVVHARSPLVPCLPEQRRSPAAPGSHRPPACPPSTAHTVTKAVASSTNRDHVL